MNKKKTVYSSNDNGSIYFVERPSTSNSITVGCFHSVVLNRWILNIYIFVYMVLKAITVCINVRYGILSTKINSAVIEYLYSSSTPSALWYFFFVNIQKYKKMNVRVIELIGKTLASDVSKWFIAIGAKISLSYQVINQINRCTPYGQSLFFVTTFWWASCCKCGEPQKISNFQLVFYQLHWMKLPKLNWKDFLGFIRRDSTRSITIHGDLKGFNAIQRGLKWFKAIQNDSERFKPIRNNPKRTKTIQSEPKRTKTIQNDPKRTKAFQSIPNRTKTMQNVSSERESARCAEIPKYDNGYNGFQINLKLII